MATKAHEPSHAMQSILPSSPSSSSSSSLHPSSLSNNAVDFGTYSLLFSTFFLLFNDYLLLTSSFFFFSFFLLLFFKKNHILVKNLKQKPWPIWVTLGMPLLIMPPIMLEGRGSGETVLPLVLL